MWVTDLTKSFVLQVCGITVQSIASANFNAAGTWSVVAQSDTCGPHLQVMGDLRLITSNVFKTKYSMRFPKVDCIRRDKGPEDVQTEQELIDTVNQKHGEGKLANRDFKHSGHECRVHFGLSSSQSMAHSARQLAGSAAKILFQNDWAGCGDAVATGKAAVAAGPGGRGGNKRRRKQTVPRSAGGRPGVLDMFLPTDVSHVEVSSTHVVDEAQSGKFNSVK